MKFKDQDDRGGFFKSHPTRGAWIEMLFAYLCGFLLESHPTRGAWIEIVIAGVVANCISVAPHAGCVD